MSQNKWELILHDNVEDPYYELTNGQTTLCAKCGFVGDTEDDEDIVFARVLTVLNRSGIDWHSENKLELEQHLEIQKLQYELEAEKAKSLRILTALKKLVNSYEDKQTTTQDRSTTIDE